MITDEQLKRNLQRNIRRLLDQTEMSQSDLARATGESRSRISLVINSCRVPSAASLARIAEALDTTVDELINSPRRKRSA